MASLPSGWAGLALNVERKALALRNRIGLADVLGHGCAALLRETAAMKKAPPGYGEA
jgi:hypothetical protein